MSWRTKWKLPREHGAWAMLYVPLLIGWLVAWRVSWRMLLFVLSVTWLFIAREALLIWWRARVRGRAAEEARRLTLIYLGLGGLCGAPLVFFDRLFGLVPFALLGALLLAVNARQAARREERTVLGEILAIIGLTMTAPAAHYVARGSWESSALWLWALSALYFASSVFYVKLRVLAAHARQPQRLQQAWRQCAVYHAFLLAALLALAWTGSLHLFALLAFAPVLGRTCWHLLQPARQLDLRRVGLLEILYSLIFLVFITLTFRLAWG
jgi:hypothetical protein